MLDLAQLSDINDVSITPTSDTNVVSAHPTPGKVWDLAIDNWRLTRCQPIRHSQCLPSGKRWVIRSDCGWETVRQT